MQTAFFNRAGNETPAELGSRLRNVAEKLAADPATSLVLLHVSDDAVGTPEEMTFDNAPWDAALTADGPSLEGLEGVAAVYEVDRRIIKRQPRGDGGARTPGFTLVCPTVRKPGMTHEDYDRHWAENHGPIHVENSPATCHYEQFTVSRALTDGAPEFDGFGRLSFESSESFANEMFTGPEAQQNIQEDMVRFLDVEKTSVATWATSEYVYKDPVDA